LVKEIWEMRTSGGRGLDAWLIVIPVVALVVAGTMSAGGIDAALLTLNHAIRDTVIAGLNLVRRLF
jgi:hypothetical protein